MEELPKKKRQITEKQREARLANLANGRKKRAAMLQQKKTFEQDKQTYEYDISSRDSNDSDGSSDFVISRKKPTKARKEPQKSETDSNLRNDMNELRNIVTELAILQKKTKQRASSEGRSKGSGTKVIVVPQPVSQSKPSDDYMEKLRKSIFD